MIQVNCYEKWIINGKVVALTDPVYEVLLPPNAVFLYP